MKINGWRLIFVVVFTGWTSSGIMAEPLQSVSKAPKILNGVETNISKWPWMASLITSGVSVFNGQFCGGTLISNRWILTAAHCVVGETTVSIQVLLGHTRLSGVTENDLRSISQIMIHPSYNEETLDADIALLELSQETTITPIQTLGHYSLDNSVGTIATALGWGNTSSGIDTFPDTLHEVDLPIVHDELCAQGYDDFTENMFCAGFPSGEKDTCVGDSGGPLVVFDKASQHWRQAGITSFGTGCETEGFFGGYTQVKNFSDFISSTICLDSELPAAPIMTLQVFGNKVTANWTKTTDVGGYRLNYAPYPDAMPIESIDLQNQDNFSITLPSGSAFFVAVNAYDGNCRSGLSNIDHFIIN